MYIIAQAKELPEFLQKLCNDKGEEEELRRELNEYFYAELLENAGENLLVRIGKRFEFGAIEEACRSFHRGEVGKRGQQALYTSSHLSRALLVKYLSNWSYETTAQELKTNMVVRWFVGYPFYGATLSDTTLWRFEQWVKENEPALIFTETLKQILEEFPEEREKVQVGDTFAMLAQVNAQTRTEMLRMGSERVLEYLRAVSEEAAEAVRFGVDREALFGSEKEKRECFLEKAERIAREEETALATSGFLRLIYAQLGKIELGNSIEHVALSKWIGYLEKVLRDEFECHYAEEAREGEAPGRIVKMTLREKHVKGAYALGSMLDPEATFRNHGKRSDFCYNISVAATDNFIFEIAAATGATPDASGVPLLITAQMAALGSVPAKLIYDQAAGMPKYIAEVARVSENQTQLVVRLVNNAKNRKSYGPTDFTLGKHGELICPNGQISTSYSRSQSADGYKYRFSPEQCTDCPLLAKCRGENANHKGRRTVFISDYTVQQREAIAYSQTPQFEQEMKWRAHIERIISGTVRYNGARRARSRGTAAADFQAKMNAMAYNLKRWGVLTAQRDKAHKARAPG